MLSTTIKELKNIPVSMSILYEQEYNLYNVLKSTQYRFKKRRAFSEQKYNANLYKETVTYKNINNIDKKYTLDVLTIDTLYK